MVNEYDAIVIGSGLGGLTAGAIYTQAGHQVLVLEQNESFGGAATTYHRGGMTIETSLHETTDPRITAEPKSEIFETLDLYKDIDFVPVGDIFEVRSALIGEPLAIPHGVDKLRAHLTERFPEEETAIREYLNQFDLIQSAMEIFLEKHNGLWWLAHGAELPFRLWPALRDLQSSVSEVLDRYFGDNEALKFAVAANLSQFSDDPDQMWWLMYAVAQGGFIQGGGRYIKGGSQVLSDQLISRIHDGGGAVFAGQRVVEILLGEKGEAIGVRYQPSAGGEETIAHASVVFANASPHAVGTMLPDPHRENFMMPYQDKPLSISLFSLNLGLNRLPSELGVSAYSTRLIPDWMTQLTDFKYCAGILSEMPGSRMPALSVVDYGQINSGLTQGQVHPVNVIGVDQLSNWSELSKSDYHEKKNAWLNAVIERLDIEWPGFVNAIVFKDMATARTMSNYLATPGGALYGFAPNVPKKRPVSGLPTTPKTSIPGLWLASAYAGAGGFSGVMGAGGAAAKAALRDTSSV